MSQYFRLSPVNHEDLTDGGDTNLHYHTSDRDLVNATGVLPTGSLTGSYEITSSWATSASFALNVSSVNTETASYFKSPEYSGSRWYMYMNPSNGHLIFEYL